MGLIHKTGGNKISVPALLALILGLMLCGGMSGPAWAAPIGCGQCHSNPPLNTDGCKQTVSQSHPGHSQFDPSGSVYPIGGLFNYTGAVTHTSVCLRCHQSPPNSQPTLLHDNTQGLANVTSMLGIGMHYTYGTADNGTCVKTCHKNESTSTWGGTVDCNACHFRSGALGNVTPSGAHGTAQSLPLGSSYGHYSSLIKVTNNTLTITCTNCHQSVSTTDIGPPIGHISGTDTFRQRADISNAHSVMASSPYINGSIGYKWNSTGPALGSCTASCHANYTNYTSHTSVFTNRTVLFSPTVRNKFGSYTAGARWGYGDLYCIECHSAPSQSSTYGGSSSINANNHHKAHLFTYKLSANNPNITGDRNIYCTDCHRFPSPTSFGTRAFKGHSTVGQGGGGVISLPVKSTNVKMNLTYKNNNIGQNGVNPAKFSLHTTTINKVLQPPTTCSNVYCHTALYASTWTDQACNSCHGTQNGVLTGSGAPGYSNATSVDPPGYQDYVDGGGAHYMHVNQRGYSCNTCHCRGGKDGNPANHNNVNENGVPSRTYVNVNVSPQWWFKNSSSVYNKNTLTCTNVRCHYGTSPQWTCP